MVGVAERGARVSEGTVIEKIIRRKFEMRDLSGLRRGGPGRPKGVPNRATLEVREFSASIVDDPAYQQRVRERALAGELPPAIESLLWHYRWGKPKEDAHIEGTLVVRWEDEEGER
jgi:hypothetical protein